MTRVSPSTKLLIIVSKQRITMAHPGNKMPSNANETRTGTRIVGVVPVEEPKRRAKMASVVGIISRIKVAAAEAMVRTTNLSSNSSSRGEVEEVELLAPDSPNTNRKGLRQASRVSRRVQLSSTRQVPPQCRQDLHRQGLCEVAWDKTSAQN